MAVRFSRSSSVQDLASQYEEMVGLQALSPCCNVAERSRTHEQGKQMERLKLAFEIFMAIVGMIAIVGVFAAPLYWWLKSLRFE